MTDAMDAVADLTAGITDVFGLNEVETKPYPYSVYSAALGRGDSYTLDSREGLRHGRVVVQSFGRTATSALAHAEEVRAALVGERLGITGYESTPLRADWDDPTVVRDPDDQGVVGVTATYSFTVNPRPTEET